MERTWKSHGDPYDTHFLALGQTGSCYVSRYATDGSKGYNWQASQGECVSPNLVISGTAPTLEAAMREAERHLDMPTSEFNAIVALKLIKQRDDLNLLLAQLGVNADTSDDRYATGYADGFEAARTVILEALEARRAKVTS